jgi:hypothetical protein
MRSKRFDDAFNKLARAEEQFRQSEFLAPVVHGGEVRVRVAGVVCKLRVTPREFEGWGVFRPTSGATAELVREAGLAERRGYLELFPIVRLVLCRNDAGTWLALPAHRGDSRLHIQGLVPARLAEDVQQFDVVRTRFDGGNFWFESLEPARDPSTAAWLRQKLAAITDPNQLDRSGLTPEERSAYEINYLQLEEARKRIEAEQVEQRMRAALEHAGAKLVDYLERRDSYRVTYTIGRQRHTSAVRKSDMTVEVAGICLSGLDRQFDLASLVGVIREAQEGHQFVRVGDEVFPEERYWQVHPDPNR